MAGGLIVGLSLAASSVASASASDGVTLNSNDGRAQATKTDDGYTASFSVINGLTTALPVSVAVTDATSTCSADPATSQVPANRQIKVEITVVGCELTDGLAMTLTVGATAFDVVIDAPAAADPDWNVLWAFALAGGLSLVAIGATVTTWLQKDSVRTAGMPLPGLAASWTFKDSWASNATVITALFAGVFGAKEVLNAILGESDSKDVLAVALVSSAVALGLVGLGPAVVQVVRVYRGVPVSGEEEGADDTPKAGYHPTPFGIAAAGVVTATGAGGQLGALLWILRGTDLWEDHVYSGLLIGAGVLLIIYMVAATWQNLTIGAKSPAASKTLVRQLDWVITPTRAELALADDVDPPTIKRTMLIAVPSHSGRPPGAVL